MRILAVILIFLGGPARCNGYLIDAFGIVPVEKRSESRTSWSGLSLSNEIQTIRPSGKPDSLLIFVGPKSIVVGREKGQAVALVLDSANNLVTGGELVDFNFGPGDHQSTPVKNGIADALFSPGVRSGIVHVNASLKNLQSARATVRVMSDFKTTNLTVPIVPGEPKYESIARISTDLLTDHFGNIVEDGVSTRMLIRHSDDQITILSSVVKDGRAQAQFLTRDIPQSGRIRLAFGNSYSESSLLYITPLDFGGPTKVSVESLGSLRAIRIKVGPVLTDAGHHLSDGAAISVVATNAFARSTSTGGWLSDGLFETTLSLDPESGPFIFNVTTFFGQQTAIADVDKSENK